MIEVSVEQGVVECFRHEGEECPRCDGSGYRPRKQCAGCGEPSGRPSKGGKALIALRGRRDFDGPLYCMGYHPQMNGQGAEIPKGSTSWSVSPNGALRVVAGRAFLPPDPHY